MSLAIALQMIARVKNANKYSDSDSLSRTSRKNEKQATYEDFAIAMAVETKGAKSAVRQYKYGDAKVDAAALNSKGQPIALIEAKTTLTLDGLSRFIIQTSNFRGAKIIVCGKSQVSEQNDIYRTAVNSGIRIYDLFTEYSSYPDDEWVADRISLVLDTVHSI